MSALVKLSGDESIPLDDLRTLSRVQVLCVVGSRSGRFSFFADHPPLERRLEHLERISRELGKLVS